MPGKKVRAWPGKGVAWPGKGVAWPKKGAWHGRRKVRAWPKKGACMKKGHEVLTEFTAFVLRQQFLQTLDSKAGALPVWRPLLFLRMVFLIVFNGAEPHQFFEILNRFNIPDGAGFSAYDHGVRDCSQTGVLDAAQEGAA